MAVEQKLRQMGLDLPEAPSPVAAYVPTVRTGNLVFVSGQIPREKSEVKYRGHLGVNVSLEDGRVAARLCALNALAAIKKEIGDLGRVRRIVKLTGYVACGAGFTDQPKVLDGASQFLIDLFGDVNELPLGVCVELEMIVEVTA
jgi:enamine deaminase RidA (YjgF/YER057c/UK114 family)